MRGKGSAYRFRAEITQRSWDSKYSKEFGYVTHAIDPKHI